MTAVGKDDPFLAHRLKRYDSWAGRGKVSFSSRVIPVTESLELRQWVLPGEQVMQILRQARSIAVQNCECRSHYQRCDNPLEVCFLLNETGDRYVAQNQARRVSLAEAAQILKNANQSGLVHLALYMPDHELYALCSCCSCCCHDLQMVRLYDRPDLMVHSEYVAITDDDTCMDCGECVDRCMFQARIMEDDRMLYRADACLGCGLCVTVCPVQATSMQLRVNRSTTTP
jgi:Pyruvate/2-oxoacid:ferredoxin oxidoreductase delta subunit